MEKYERQREKRKVISKEMHSVLLNEMCERKKNCTENRTRKAGGNGKMKWQCPDEMTR